MCHDRGYLVMQKELDQTLEEFKEAVGDPPSRKDLLMVVNHEEDPADMLYVFFPEEEKVNMKIIRAYVDQMQQDRTYKAILVLQEGGLTPAANSVSCLLCFYTILRPLLRCLSSIHWNHSTKMNLWLT